MLLSYADGVLKFDYYARPALKAFDIFAMFCDVLKWRYKLQNINSIT